MSRARTHLFLAEVGWMRFSKLQAGAVTAVTGISPAGGALLLGAP